MTNHAEDYTRVISAGHCDGRNGGSFGVICHCCRRRSSRVVVSSDVTESTLECVDGDRAGQDQRYQAEQPVEGEADVANPGPEGIIDELGQFCLRQGVRVMFSDNDRGIVVGILLGRRRDRNDVGFLVFLGQQTGLLADGHFVTRVLYNLNFFNCFVKLHFSLFTNKMG